MALNFAPHLSPPATFNAAELELITLNTTHLAIASHLYPEVLYPHELNLDHVAAIRLFINDQVANAPSFAVLMINTVIDFDPETIISQARAYGKYRNYLAEPELETNVREELFADLMDQTCGMDLPEFCAVMSNWYFIEKLERGGDPVRWTVLMKGWVAYQQVPDDIKRELDLIDVEYNEEDSEDSASTVKGGD